MVFLFTLTALVASALGGLADVRSLRIPNAYSAIVAVAFAAAYALSPASFQPLKLHLVAAGIIFVVTLIMYAVKAFGAGDTKLASVLALWVGTKGLMVYLFYMALLGGVLGVAALVIRRRKLFTNAPDGSWASQLHAGRNAVPYGVAISTAAWATLFHTGLINKQLHELFSLIGS